MRRRDASLSAGKKRLRPPQPSPKTRRSVLGFDLSATTPPRVESAGRSIFAFLRGAAMLRRIGGLVLFLFMVACELSAFRDYKPEQMPPIATQIGIRVMGGALALVGLAMAFGLPRKKEPTLPQRPEPPKPDDYKWH